MVDEEIKLKRFLYLTSLEPKYVVFKKASRDLYFKNEIPKILEFASKMSHAKIIEIIAAVNKENLCARRDTLLFALAYFCRNLVSDLPGAKAAIYNIVLNTCKNTDELFMFLRLATNPKNNLSHGLKRILHNFYSSKSPTEFAKIVIARHGYHGWTHKDVLRMIHLKPANLEQEIITTFVFKNANEATKIYSTNSQKTYPDADKIITLLQKLDKLRHCQENNTAEAAKLILENKFTYEQIPVGISRSQIVWEALIPQFDIPSLFDRLRNLSRLGFLKPNSISLKKTVDVITDPKKCQHCKIHPVDVYIEMKFFERGKPIDPKRQAHLDMVDLQQIETAIKEIEVQEKEGCSAAGDPTNTGPKAATEPKPSTEPKEPTEPKASNSKPKQSNEIKGVILGHPHKNVPVLSAFHKCLQNSYKNIQHIKQRIFIAVSIQTQNMNRACLPYKIITYLEGVSMFVSCLVNFEKSCTVGVFKGKDMTMLAFEKGVTMREVQDKISAAEIGYTLLSSPIRWAASNKQPFDIFINCLYSSDVLNRIPRDQKVREDPMISLDKYRKKNKLPTAKMVNISFGCRNLDVAGKKPYVLDICGIDGSVFTTIKAFSRGYFQ